jgi:hypothetical protein
MVVPNYSMRRFNCPAKTTEKSLGSSVAIRATNSDNACSDIPQYLYPAGNLGLLLKLMRIWWLFGWVSKIIVKIAKAYWRGIAVLQNNFATHSILNVQRRGKVKQKNQPRLSPW